MLHLAARALYRCLPVSSTLDSGMCLIRASRLLRDAPLECKTKTEGPRQCNAAVNRTVVLFAGIQRRRRRIAPTRGGWQPNQGPPPTGRQISTAISARSARALVQRAARRPAPLAAKKTQGSQSDFPSTARRSTTRRFRSVQVPSRRLTWRSTGPTTACHPGRATALPHHRPHGQGVTPPRAG